MRSALLLPLAALALATTHAAEKPPLSAEKLVDSVIVQPGVYDQMCDMPPPLPAKLPLYVYGMVMDREMHASDAQLVMLRARRAEVVPVLVARLKAMELSKVPPPITPTKFKKDDEAVAASGLSTHALTGPFYEMLTGLDAVEALPELLRLEEQMRSLLAAAEANPKLPPPAVTLDGMLTTGGKVKLSKRDVKMQQGRAVQRELLSVMLQLLRGQRYAPLMNSELEAAYATAVKKRAQDEDLRDIKTPADAKAKDAGYIKFDPVYNVPVGYLKHPAAVPFSPESRNLVRGMAEEFLQTVPPAQWKVNPPAP